MGDLFMFKASFKFFVFILFHGFFDRAAYFRGVKKKGLPRNERSGSFFINVKTRD